MTSPFWLITQGIRLGAFLIWRKDGETELRRVCRKENNVRPLHDRDDIYRITDRAAAEKALDDDKIIFQLSSREKEIVAQLSR